MQITSRILQISTKSGDWVLDPFCGEGSMLIKAFQHDRKFIGCESSEEGFSICKKFLNKHEAKYFELNFEGLKLEPIVNNDYILLEPTEEEGILMRIRKGENLFTEFKESAIWDYRKGVKDVTLKDNIVKSVCGFLNSESGGELFIGVLDDGTLQDLKEDFKAVNSKKCNFDGYVLYLNDIILSELGKVISNKYKIDRFEINECEICRIRIESSTIPVFYRGEFIMRSNGQSIKFNCENFYKYLLTTGFENKLIK